MSGIEFEGVLELFFKARPIPVMQPDVSQRGVGFAECLVYLKSLPGREYRGETVFAFRKASLGGITPRNASSA